MNVKILNLGWDVTVMRFFLMMFLVIAGVLMHVWFIAFLGLPVFLSAILGISFEWETKKRVAGTAKMVSLSKEKRSDKKVS